MIRLEQATRLNVEKVMAERASKQVHDSYEVVELVV